MKPMLWVAALLVLVLLGWLYTPDRSRASLEATYARGPDDFMMVAGLRLHLRVTGPTDASAIVLIHGFGASLHTWEGWAQSLPTFRVIRFDLPGFGLTGPDPTGDYSDARSSAVLLALLDALQVQQAVVVGNSLGGRIAWQFAAAHPERVNKLVLIAPDGFASPEFEYGKPPKVPMLLHLMRYALPKPLMKMSLAPGYARPELVSDEVVTRYYDLLLAPGVRTAILNRLEQTVLTFPPPLLNRIHAPVLLLWGAQDKMIPAANAADYQQALPNSKLVTLAGEGHLLHEEAPLISVQVLKEFIEH